LRAREEREKRFGTTTTTTLWTISISIQWNSASRRKKMSQLRAEEGERRGR